MPYTAPSQVDWFRLADRSIAGELLTREEARAVLDAPDSALLEQLAAAYRVRQVTWAAPVTTCRGEDHLFEPAGGLMTSMSRSASSACAVMPSRPVIVSAT